jgi:hypothetical protein
MFIKLAKQAYEIAAERGIQFVYGFPNANSHHGFVRKLGWTDLHNGIPLWVKPLNLEAVIRKRLVGSKVIAAPMAWAGKRISKLLYGGRRSPAVCSIREVSLFDQRFDSLWDEASRDHNILAIRDKAYLNWRYVEEPGKDHAIFVAESGEKLLGFVVLTCTERFGFRIGLVMDILTIPQGSRIATSLLCAGVNYFELSRVDIAGCLMPPGASYAPTLKGMGFVRAPRWLLPQDIYWGVCGLSPHHGVKLLADPRNWFITWGDTDV